MIPTILFAACAIILVVIVYALWRYWDNMVNLTPEEEAFDRRVKRLNERQANRISDEDLARPLSEEDAWRIMVARGQQALRRRSRYGGSLDRRARERKR